MKWRTTRKKIEDLFVDEKQRGGVLALDKSLLIGKIDDLQGLSDRTIRTVLCKLAGVPESPGDYITFFVA